jgi:PAS domain S-box-containing protein
VAVIEVLPRRVLVAAGSIVLDSSLLAGIAAVLCALLLSIVFARSLARPLVQMTAAVDAFGRGEPMKIPTAKSGEIGVLARAFARMSSEVQEKRAALEREIEEHRRTAAARERLADRERLFGAAVQSSNDAIVTQTLDGIITGWNPASERVFGFGADEAIGQSIDIIVPGGARDPGQGRLRRDRVSLRNRSPHQGRQDHRGFARCLADQISVGRDRRCLQARP